MLSGKRFLFRRRKETAPNSLDNPPSNPPLPATESTPKTPPIPPTLPKVTPDYEAERELKKEITSESLESSLTTSPPVSALQLTTTPAAATALPTLTTEKSLPQLPPGARLDTPPSPPRLSNPIKPHRRIQICIEQNAFYLRAEAKRPTGGTKAGLKGESESTADFDGDTLKVEFASGVILRDDSYVPAEDTKVYEIYGIVGILNLCTGPHLIVIIRRTLVGHIEKNLVYRLDKIGILPFKSAEADRILRRLKSQLNHDEALSPTAPPYSAPLSIADGGINQEDSGSTDETSSIATTPVSPVEEDFTSHGLQMLSPDETMSETNPNITITAAAEDLNSETPQNALNIHPSEVRERWGRRWGSTGMDCDNNSKANDSKPDEDDELASTPPSSPPLAYFLASSPIRALKSARTALADVTERSMVGTPMRALKSATNVIADVTERSVKTVTVSAMRLSNLAIGKAPAEDVAMDEKIIRELLFIFNAGTFFFSYDMDIMNSTQRLAHVQPGESLWERTDKRFFWNESMLEAFTAQKLHEWVLPIMQGFVQVEKCVMEDIPFDFVLISRRSRDRAGLRYERRGVDDQGHVANFVETEQIVFVESPTKLKPIPMLERSVDENVEAFKRHFEDLERVYKHTLIVNLVEQEGREALVGQKFRETVAKLKPPNVSYVEFDFHSNCKGLDFGNLRHMLAMTETELNSSIQDCLDRTNVAQSVFARHVLNLVLFRLGVQSSPEKGINHHEAFESTFKQVWANNGDTISRSYTGTIALKSDFTRTGKRNLQGLMNDATNSLTR
ncbi:hypothetical protein HK102_002030, partial [Quaeritorhiza haematococci]